MANLPSTPIITLTTDFGLADHYVGTMKCVISKIWTHPHIIDVTHQVAPGDIQAAAYAISQAAPFCPVGTIHVVVVDPGVGTDRKPIAARVDQQIFIAPDNGLLTLVISDATPDGLGNGEIRQLDNPKAWLHPASATFHGRDLFAPAAAHLAAGNITWEALGPKLDRCILLPDLKPAMEAAGRWRGIALNIDRFGNIVTNFKISLVGDDSRWFAVNLNGRSLRKFRRTFADAPPGEPFLYFGSSGYLEIAINHGHAASELGTHIGDLITLERGA